MWRGVLPDERDEIAARLARLCDEDVADVVLSTGGTGFAPRDVTPEAARAVLERLSPGIDEALRADALRHTPHGALSRGVSGTRGAHDRDHAAGQPEGLRGGLGRARARARARRPPAALRADDARAMSAVAIAQRFANLVRLEHTVFALPYAYVGAILAVDGWPGISVLGWITVAMVGARSFAMAVNRLVDAAIDARNPRTAGRELPAGRLKRSQVIAFALASLAVFVIGISQLPVITRWLAPIVIVAMVVYPYLKRVTPLCHVWLGVVDGLAPVGGWVAVTGHFDRPAWLLGRPSRAGSPGFDIIYATMDIEVDRAQGLHSLPADYGVARALYASRTLHALSVVALAAVGWSLGLGPIYAVGVVAVAALLAYEQQLVSPDDRLARRHGVPERQRGHRPRRHLGTVSLDVALS